MAVLTILGLAWRDNQTIIGLAWALLRPLLTMFILLVFGRLTNINLI